jgi:hemerythrin
MEDKLAWSDAFDLGDEAMDAEHREFVAYVDALLRAPDHELPARLAAFTVHARNHFRGEDEAMRRGGYDAGGCHVDEHAAVLKSVDEAALALQAGRVGIVRALARALAAWFPEHVRVMDTGLARWKTEERFGGAPILVQRSLARSARQGAMAGAQ